MELSLKDLAVRQYDLSLPVQIVIHKASLIQALSVYIPAEAIYLVRAVLREHQLALVKRIITEIDAPNQTLLLIILAKLHLSKLLNIPNPEFFVELQLALLDQLNEVEARSFIHVYIEKLAAFILVEYFVDGLVKDLLDHF